MNGDFAPAGPTPTLSELGGRVRRWAARAATPGSAQGLVLAAAAGVIAFAGSVAAVPARAPAVAAAEPSDVAPSLTQPPAPAPVATPQTSAEALAPMGAPPLPAIDRVLDYPVVFFWPSSPQTVAEPAAIREGPATGARILRSARPGERLRINGRVADAPAGPWLRVRLPDGRDGYLSARTMDVGAYRRKRATETAGAAAPDTTMADVTGAPLMPTPPDEGPDPDIGPPSF